MTQSGDQSNTNRIDDQDSGLGVEWVRDEPPMERRAHFRLWIKEREVPFSASYSFGSDVLHRKLRAQGVSVGQIVRMTPSEDAVFYEAQNIDADFDRARFVELWQQVLSKRHAYSVAVLYRERKSFDEPWREWSGGAQRVSTANAVYDEESGLGVDWVRDEPPLERHAHFRLWIGEREVPFSASYEFGSERVMRANRDMSWPELQKTMNSADRSVVFTALTIKADFDRDKFLELWQQVLSERYRDYAVGVRYLEGHPPDVPFREWSRGV